MKVSKVTVIPMGQVKLIMVQIPTKSSEGVRKASLNRFAKQVAIVRNFGNPVLPMQRKAFILLVCCVCVDLP